MDTMETMLYGEPSGLGIVLDAAVFATTILDEPPVVTRVEPHSAAERYELMKVISSFKPIYAKCFFPSLSTGRVHFQF